MGGIWTKTTTEGKWTYEDKSSDLRYAAINQGTPRIGGKHQKLGRGKQRSSSRAFRRSMAVSTP
jgi:hypothetical protein